MLEYETRYSQVEKECLTLAWAAKKLDHYLQSYTTLVVSKTHPLKHLFESRAQSNRTARWTALLSQYDLKCVTRKSIKGRAVAEFLALNSTNEKEVEFEFPDEDLMVVEVEDTWEMYFDGASNRNGDGIGVLIITPQKKPLVISVRFEFPVTNNVAEYEACITGLNALLDLGATTARVHGDSAIVVQQSKKEWITKDERLKSYQEMVQSLVSKFEEVEFNQIPRTENVIADALATLASNLQLPDGYNAKPMIVLKQHRPSYDLVKEVCQMGVEPWYADIKKYVESQEYPEGATKQDKQAIRRLASNFVICGGQLYKRWHEGVQLRCVDEEQSKYLMKEVHDGECGPHMNGRALAKKIIRLGYYWQAFD